MSKSGILSWKPKSKTDKNSRKNIDESASEITATSQNKRNRSNRNNSRRFSLEQKVNEWKEKQEQHISSTKLLHQWTHATDAIMGKFHINRGPFADLLSEVITRAQALTTVAEFKNLEALAKSLSLINKNIPLSKDDPINAFLREWHKPNASWRQLSFHPREAVMLALLSVRFATEARRIESEGASPFATTHLVVRAVEAVTKAELSHDLVAANVAFHLLAERAMEAGRQEGITHGKVSISASGGKGRAEKYEPIRAESWRLARKNTPPSGKWKSRSQAVKNIKLTVIEFAKQHGAALSEDQAFTTIDGWLAAMPDADTLFARKRTTLASKDTPSTS